VLTALGSVIDFERLPVLIERAIDPKHADDTNAASAGVACRQHPHAGPRGMCGETGGCDASGIDGGQDRHSWKS
jgi:hypothetical protein